MKIKGKYFTIGADPEVFLVQDEQWKAPFSYTKGTKRNPEVIGKNRMGLRTVQVDGVALEFNTEPCETFTQFNNSIRCSLNYLKRKVERDGLGISMIPRALPSWPEVPHENRQLGCDRDFNAWDFDWNSPPVDEDNRYAGGHIHIGWTKDQEPTEENLFICSTIVKELDASIGLASVICDLYGAERRQRYGKAGSFRLKPYGLEYRVLSNYWIFTEGMRRYITFTLNQTLFNILSGVFMANERVRELIRDDDYDYARGVLGENGYRTPPYMNYDTLTYLGD